MSKDSQTHITLLFNSFRQGAVTNLYKSMLRYSATARFRYSILALESADMSMREEFEKIGINTVELDKGNTSWLARYRQLIRCLQEMKPDCLHTHLSKSNLLGPRAGKKAGIPVIISTHHTIREGYSWMIRALLPLTQKYCTARTFVSRAVKDTFSGSECLKENEYVIYNGVELNSIPDSLKSDSENQNGFVIAQVGRLIPEKNHNFTLSVFREFLEDRPNSELWIVGAGPEEDRIRGDVRKMNLSKNVKMMGFQADLKALLQKVDVIINPSTREGFNMTMLESMAFGIPFLGSALPQNSECISNGVNGILIEQFNTDDYVMALSQLTGDIDFRNGIIQAAKKRVEDFSAQKAMNQYEDLYQSCIIQSDGQ